MTEVLHINDYFQLQKRSNLIFPLLFCSQRKSNMFFSKEKCSFPYIRLCNLLINITLQYILVQGCCSFAALGIAFTQIFSPSRFYSLWTWERRGFNNPVCESSFISLPCGSAAGVGAHECGLIGIFVLPGEFSCSSALWVWGRAVGILILKDCR